MADMYVDDGGSNTAPYDTWAKAAVKLATALAAQAAGETVYIGSDHVETEGANLTLACTNGTSASPIKVISADRTSGEPPATYQNMVDGGGSVNSGATFDIVFTGSAIHVGLFFTNGDDITMSDADCDLFFEDCKIRLNNLLTFGGLGDQLISWRNVALVCTGPVYLRNTGARFVWSGGSLSFDGGSINGGLLNPIGRGGIAVIEDVDLSGLVAGDYLIKTPNNVTHQILFKRCKLNAALAGVLSAAIAGAGVVVKVHSCSSSDIIYQLEEQYFEGALYSDTSTYRNSAATYDGTNEYSIKMVSSANAIEWVKPLRFKLAEIWCSANPTLAVELNIDNVVLQNDEFWIEIEYPDDTIGAYGKIDRTSKPTNVLTAPANLTTSAVAWTEAFGTEKPQKISETIAGGQAGIHTVWACLAKPSTTVYVCPKVDVS